MMDLEEARIIGSILLHAGKLLKARTNGSKRRELKAIRRNVDALLLQLGQEP